MRALTSDELEVLDVVDDVVLGKGHWNPPNVLWRSERIELEGGASGRSVEPPSAGSPRFELLGVVLEELTRGRAPGAWMTLSELPRASWMVREELCAELFLAREARRPSSTRLRVEDVAVEVAGADQDLVVVLRQVLHELRGAIGSVARR